MPKFALMIGINYTGSDAQLNGCVNDVLNMKRWLLEKRNFVGENIVVMTDGAVTRDERLLPNRENILREVGSVVSRLRSGDTLFIHYSGHGSYQRDANGDERDRRDETICPVDMKFITDDELKAVLVNRIPRGAKLRAIFDACHSASLLDLRYMWRSGAIFTDESADTKLSNDILCISGTRDDDTSADASIDGSAQGAMTWSLLDSVSRSDNWTWTELITLMRDRLIQGGYTQVPQLAAASRKVVKNKIDV